MTSAPWHGAFLIALVAIVAACQRDARTAESPDEDLLAYETEPTGATSEAEYSDGLSEAPPCSDIRETGIPCSGVVDGLGGCRDLAERRCGRNNYRILCVDRQESEGLVALKYACVEMEGVTESHRARKASTGLCHSDADCAAGPGWQEVCFSTVVDATPTAGQCGDLRQVVAGNPRSVASDVDSEQKCTATKPCKNGETCIRLLSAHRNVCAP